MLVDIWERILEALDSSQNAAVLLGVDYKKAFNRMDHAVCLERLRQLGASDGSIALIRTFLMGRKMTVTIDGHMALPIGISKGSLEGSGLGCFLYCVHGQPCCPQRRRLLNQTEEQGR